MKDFLPKEVSLLMGSQTHWFAQQPSRPDVSDGASRCRGCLWSKPAFTPCCAFAYAAEVQVHSHTQSRLMSYLSKSFLSHCCSDQPGSDLPERSHRHHQGYSNCGLAKHSRKIGCISWTSAAESQSRTKQESNSTAVCWACPLPAPWYWLQSLLAWTTSGGV